MATVSFNTYAYAFTGQTTWVSNNAWGSGNFYVGNTGAGCVIAISVNGTSDTISSLTLKLPMTSSSTETCDLNAYLYTSSTGLKPDNYWEIPGGEIASTTVSQKKLTASASMVTFTFSNLSITGKSFLYVKLNTVGGYLKTVYTGSSYGSSVSCTTGSSGGGTTTTYYAFLKYNLQGGTWNYQDYDEYSSTSSSTFNKKVTSIEPTREGYTFKGWATSATSTTVAYTAGANITLQGATGNGKTTNLYAIWASNTTTTTYYYKCYNLTREEDIAGTSTSTTSSSITRPNLSGSGYTYQGYVYYSSYSKCINQGLEGTFDGTGTTCSSHSSKNPYVVFFYTENTPTISSWQTPTQIVSLNGSSYTSYSTTSQIYKYQAGYVKYTTPSYAGKIICQTTNGNFTEDYYSHLTSATASAASGINYTKAIETTYDLASSDNIDAANGNFNTSISYECSPSTTYYWYVNGPFVNTGTYSISWKLNYYRKYSITFNANNGTGAPTTQYFYANNLQVTFPTTEPKRDGGYTFLGWSTSSTATTATYLKGETYTLNAQDYPLYAVWKKSTQNITLTYDANGGSGAPSAETQSVNIGSNANFTISSIEPTRKDYDFLGWADNADATTATYTKNSSLSISSNKTIYAVWKLQTYTVTINYNLNGGINGPSSWSQTASVGTNITTTISSTKPTKNRYKFVNWSERNSATTYTSGQSVSFSSATTLNLYATWEHLFGADNVYYGINGEWKLVETYYGVNGKWVPIKLYYGNDNKWKNNT